MQYTNLFFDLDRTLWDFEKNNELTFRELFDLFELKGKCNCSFEDFFTLYNTINNQLWDDYRNGRITKEVLMVKRFIILLDHFGAGGTCNIQQMSDFYINESPKKSEVLPYSKEVLSYLKERGYKLHIITNGFKEVQYIKLKSAELENFFDKVFISEEVGFPKPDKRVFEYALQTTTCQAQHAMMIGDDYTVDIEGANKAGMSTVFCNFQNSKTNPCVASYTISSLQELCNIL